jgi:hypothetical protein
MDVILFLWSTYHNEGQSRELIVEAVELHDLSMYGWLNLALTCSGWPSSYSRIPGSCHDHQSHLSPR